MTAAAQTTTTTPATSVEPKMIPVKDSNSVNWKDVAANGLSALGGAAIGTYLGTWLAKKFIG